ncbi:MAG TPA: DUF1800 domain-containing protein [Gemmatimonadaceae bacterium]|nr:DUF1800 domain-containing protein [Gemmatimonadaceae bacterium]
MRSFFALSVAAIAAACAAPGRTSSQIAPARAPAGALAGDLLPDEQIQQVLNRLTFGARPGDAERMRAMGIEAWIDQQLSPERIDDSGTDALVARYAVLGASTGDMVRDFNTVQQLQRQVKAADASDTSMNKAAARRDILAGNPQLAAAVRQSQQLVGQIQSAQLARAVTSERQLDEVMVDFWENHFSVFAGKGQTRLFLTSYDRDVIRPRALGKFRDLLGAVAKSPAMLFFLDNWQSAADSTHPTLAQAAGRGRGGAGRLRPGLLGGRGAIGAGQQLPPAIRDRLQNATPEERQRILQQLQQRAGGRRGLNENYARELMELHTLGVDGGYSQKDVQEVARALTGWTFNRQTGQFVFNPAIHDAGEKLILGQKFPAGHGEDEGERVLDILARHRSTARFITTKLARHFVSDEPPKALVDRCAGTFSKSEGDIRETVRCVVTSPEFFSRTAYRAKVKTPFELVASALRAVNAQPDTTPRTAQIVARLGQPIFGRQTPDGWPDHGDAWMNTGAILNRINFGLALAAGQIPGASLSNWPEFATLRAQSRAQQVDAVVRSMLGGQVSPETRDVLMSGDNPMLGAAKPLADSVSMGGARGRSPGGPPARALGGGRGGQLPGFGRPVNLQGLPQVVGLALGAPEFQRR